MILVILLGRLITLAQRISIIFLTASTLSSLYSDMFLSLFLSSHSLHFPLYPLLFGTYSALTQPICQLAQHSFSTNFVIIPP